MFTGGGKADILIFPQGPFLGITRLASARDQHHDEGDNNKPKQRDSAQENRQGPIDVNNPGGDRCLHGDILPAHEKAPPE
jgi:hypothetical protein